MPEYRGKITLFDSPKHIVQIGALRVQCTPELYANVLKHFRLGDFVLVAYEASQPLGQAKAFVRKDSMT